MMEEKDHWENKSESHQPESLCFAKTVVIGNGQ